MDTQLYRLSEGFPKSHSDRFGEAGQRPIVYQGPLDRASRKRSKPNLLSCFSGYTSFSSIRNNDNPRATSFFQVSRVMQLTLRFRDYAMKAYPLSFSREHPLLKNSNVSKGHDPEAIRMGSCNLSQAFAYDR